MIKESIMSKYIILAITLILMLSCVPSAQAKGACMATTPAAISNAIANGHAWRKHRNEFVAGKAIANLAMPGSPQVATIAEFKSLIQSVMASHTNKSLSRRRKAYWGSPTGTIVIYDPVNADCGTAFRPNDGKLYYDRQN
jgi:hypothetical protein